MHTVSSRVNAMTLALLSVLLLATEARAQDWALIDMLGYSAGGAALGLAATVESDCSDFICGQTVFVTLGGLVLGGIGGAVLGSRANRAVDDGVPLSPAHRNAVAAGTVLAGATLGAAGSLLLINGEGEGTFLGSDEQTFALLALGGAGLGALYVGGHWRELTGGDLEIRPTVLHRGRPGVVLRMSL